MGLNSIVCVLFLASKFTPLKLTGFSKVRFEMMVNLQIFCPNGTVQSLLLLLLLLLLKALEALFKS